MAKIREKVRYPIKKAKKIAAKIERKLKPLAKELVLVGSIRRKRPEVADIEFVILPKNLKKFGQAMKRMGYAPKPAGRQWTHVIDGIPIEIYVAFSLDEMGSMVQMYTGDYLYNITMRNRALARGLKYNQYGIFTRDDKTVYQSENEEDIFKYLGKDWRDPEQRSLAARQDLERMTRDLKSIEDALDEEDFEFAVEALRTLKHDKYLPAKEEIELRKLHAEHFAPIPKSKIAGAMLGAEELIELGVPVLERIPFTQFWEMWQEAYEVATDGRGRVADVFGRLNPDGSLSIWVVVEDGPRPIFFMPYWDPAPPADEVEAFIADEKAWLDSMTENTDWREAEWGPPLDEGPF